MTVFDISDHVLKNILQQALERKGHDIWKSEQQTMCEKRIKMRLLLGTAKISAVIIIPPSIYFLLAIVLGELAAGFLFILAMFGFIGKDFIGRDCWWYRRYNDLMSWLYRIYNDK
jgi:hypothetical protein